MGRPVTPTLNDPYEILCEKARAYVYRGKYPQVVVFTKFVTEYNLLISEFGGGRYRHGTGFVWILSKRSKLRELLEKVKPYLPSKHGFEKVLIEYLPRVSDAAREFLDEVMSAGGTSNTEHQEEESPNKGN